MSHAEAFRFQAGEAVPAGVTRIALGQIDAILSHLHGRPPDADAVHEIRKATKRLRALVRLVRDEVGARRYRRENHAFRDAARLLSGARDRAVMTRTLELLGDHGKHGLPTRDLQSIRHAMKARLHADHRGNGTAARGVAAAVARARNRLARWELSHDGWAALEPGIHRIYRRGRAAWRQARAAPSDEHLHEWRKRVKDLRYVMDLLEPVWTPVMKPFAKEVDELADLLGDDHDLAMLAAAIDADADVGRDGRREVMAAIDRHRRKRQDAAWALAPRIYSETPAAFVRRLGTYWKAWQKHGPSEG
jgi:CHAD domain-containing protein